MLQTLGRFIDRLAARAAYIVKPKSGLIIKGHLRAVRVRDGEVLCDEDNMLVYAGLEALVDALQAAAYVNTFKYVGFGTGILATGNSDTTLGTEIAGGSYARLTATQGEGDNAREYRLTGTWTNNSGATRVVTEYGIFSAATVGTMLARVSTGDPSPPSSKTVEVGESIAVTWDIQLADA